MDSRENGPPASAEEQDTTAKSGSKDKKSTTQLGGFALARPKSGEKSEATEDIWSKLTLTKRREGKTVEQTPLAPHSPGVANELRTQAELITPSGEDHLPVEGLNNDEAGLIERHIVSERQSQESVSDERDEGEGFITAAAEAVEAFRSKIIYEGQRAEAAFTETLTEWETALSPEPALAEAAPFSESTEQSYNILPPEAPTPEPASKPWAMTESEAASAATFTEDSPVRLSHVIEPAREPRTPLAVPTATEVRPRGLGEYHLNTFAGEGGRPSTEHVPLHDELTLRNLPGGIVGYLIGRRRGRIKTEKKMAATRKKLESQIENLEESIIAKENQIRKVVRMSKQESYEASRQPGQENSRTLALEANQLHSKQHPAERIGHVLMNSRSNERPAPKAERKPTKAATAEKAVVDHRVQTLSRAELLQMSEKVTVDNTTLRHVYETHLVSEQGLRRLVSEYIDGGNVHEALREELVEHEIDFERDPLLRDRRKQHAANISEGETLTSLLEKANALGQSETEDQLAVLKARQEHHETQRQRQQNHRRIIDVSMVAAITILFILVIMLLTRGR